MKKKTLILLTSILLTLLLGVSVVYALFMDAESSNMSFQFGTLSPTSSMTLTQNSATNFSKPGDSRSYQISVGKGASTAPFGYEISLTAGSTTDSGFAKSVLVYMDDNLLGTAASVMTSTTAFESFVYSPDRLISSETATHTLRLEYFLGAGALHSGKTLNFSVSVRASTTDPTLIGFVSTEAQLADLFAAAQAGSLAEGYRIVLLNDIALTANLNAGATLIELDLNGHSLTGSYSVTLAGGEIKSHSAASISALSVSSYVPIAETVTVTSATVNLSSADVALAATAIADYAQRQTAAAMTASKNIAGGDRIYLSAIDSVSAITCVPTGGAALDLSTGVLSVTRGLQTFNGAVALGTHSVSFQVLGTESVSTTALDALMDVQVDGRTVAYDLLLPTKIDGAQVSWWSSNPDVIAANGKYSATSSSVDVSLVATISKNGASTTATYVAAVRSDRTHSQILQEILDALGYVRFDQVGQEKFIPSTHYSSQNYASAGYSADEIDVMNNVNRLIAVSGITAFDYAANNNSDVVSEGYLSYNNTADSITLEDVSPVHIVEWLVTAAFDGGENATGSFYIYVDIATPDEALSHLSTVIETRSDLAENIRADRYHTIDSEGAELTEGAEGAITLHGNAALGSPKAGSFVLPTKYTNRTTTAVSLAAGDEIVYYYYVYRLSTAISLLDDSRTERASIPAISIPGEPAELGDTLSSIPEHNNYFLVNPSLFGTTADSITIEAGLYQLSGSIYQRQGIVRSFAVNIPAGIHQDADGFADTEVYNFIYERVVEANNMTGCAATVTDTIVADLAANLTSLSIISAEGQTWQITGSVSGIRHFSGLTSLILNGSKEVPLFSSQVAVETMGSYIGALSYLSELDLTYAGLENISWLSANVGLSRLNLKGNPKIVKVAVLMQMQGLEYLNLTDTGLTFVGATINSDSPYEAITVLDFVYYTQYNSDGYGSEIWISHKISDSAAAVDLLYVPSGPTWSAGRARAMEYISRFTALGSDVYNKLFLPGGLLGVTDATVAYRVLSGSATLNRSSGSYTSPTLSNGNWSGGTSITTTSGMYLQSSGADTYAVLQMIVIVTDNGSATNNYFCRNFEVHFTA